MIYNSLCRLLVDKIGKALKDSGGASDDYQEVIAFRHSLAFTLNTLGAFDDELACPENAAIIRAQVDCVHQPVERFLANIESKFESQLGTQTERRNSGTLSTATTHFTQPDETSEGRRRNSKV
jgi:hypothetical protein